MAGGLAEAREQGWKDLDRGGLLNALREEAQELRRRDAELTTLRATLARKESRLKQVKEQAKTYLAQ